MALLCMASVSRRLCFPLSLTSLKTLRDNLAEPKEAALEPTSLALVVCVTSSPAGALGDWDDPPGAISGGCGLVTAQQPWLLPSPTLPFYHRMTLGLNAGSSQDGFSGLGSLRAPTLPNLQAESLRSRLSSFPPRLPQVGTPAELIFKV